ncbi:MAG: hypothetical protein PHE48_03770 [Candidatus Daviesbacteria bacterium]|nr:hypothetical protein [Candidatus Daviesbacteria bacterium]MDD5416091.1 hypothetical protein [Candidatus Daviesbacteria bacterium]
MKKFSLPFLAFLQATGLLIYISLVSLIFLYGNQIFGKMNNYFGPILFLLIFVLSAIISSVLVLGRAGFLFWEKRYRQAFPLLFWTIGWISFYLAGVFLLLLLAK